jgi:hypothetical protein
MAPPSRRASSEATAANPLLVRRGYCLTCEEGPTLIKNYAGVPTAFGIGRREHLRRLRAAEDR